jgi:hypothetical protein
MLQTTVNKIDALTLQYAPQVLASVTAVEGAAAAMPGITKEQIVINTVLAGAQVASSLPIPAVSGIAALVAHFVGTLNATGVFSHRTNKPAIPAAPPTAAVTETTKSA